ncbi:hypothetical protein DLM_4309 [Aquitalea magnusonii]|jgi:hypothetical protein|uniref:LysM domain-containing protein n=1 Tax=Aquitalea magnusonii TaxID=332411 RepID=A0A3G9GQJ7_9NEIS|nr:LysM peptidoglycan-binding domain-containing protein [Aquitalea magnusonii]BBF87881.1 hypothetical protein DLM_4309 [Aquitalea magnusonii]
MRKSIISLALALGLALPAFSDTLTIKPDAPARYTVVKGDTLWGISGRYLKSPWKWPRLWQMNKSEIKNPHWIYPGDVLVLTYVNGQPRLTLEKSGQGDVRLSPQVRMSDIDKAIASIPARAIEPFLYRPLVVNEEEFATSPRLVAGPEERLAFGTGDRVFANGVSTAGNWQIYRASKPLIDPDTKENLGFEVLYGGDAQLDKMGDEIQTMRITRVASEILVGDRLIKAPKDQFVSYVPHSPDGNIQGQIISVYDGVDGAAQYSNVVINRGKREQVEPGDVFSLFKHGKPITVITADGQKKQVLLPGQTVGKIFVYRVFDKVSYALVLDSTDAVSVGDVVAPPEGE